jgi:coproporphyrinogen III oxidase-like Fe-S oxidoreductase
MVPGTALHRSIASGEKTQPRYGAQMLRMRQLATDQLGAAGYRHTGGEVFSRSDRDRFSDSFYGGHGNAMHAVLALGPSGIGHLAGTAYRNRCDLTGWQEALDRGRLPVGSATVMDRKMGRRKAVLFGLAGLHLRAELVETAQERRLVERWQGQGLLERSPEGYRLTREGGLWFNLMQLSMLPLADLAVMMKMVGSYTEQDRMVNGGTPLGDELMALAGSSGGVLGKLTALGYQTSLSLMKHLPEGSAAIRWLRR